MNTTAHSITPTLAEIAAAQSTTNIFAFELNDDEQRLARLRLRYTRLRTEWATFLDLFEEPALDISLSAADGRQLTLRLPMQQTGEVYAALRDVLSDNLRELEGEIIQHLGTVAEQAELVRQYPERNNPFGLDKRAAILALCAPGDPALPAAGSEWLRRTEAAAALEGLWQQQHSNEYAYGCEILWHPLFPAEYVACVSGLALYELAEYHEALAGHCNQDRPLDGHDLGYLADVLREALASNPTELATLRLHRALAWVEQAQLAPTGVACPQLKEGAARA